MEVISTRRYEARPAAMPTLNPGSLVDLENSIATVKEEEWETRKKKEITTTRQIETRVKRQVVLEDGEVVVDSGPVVTTNTTEDVEQQEHTTHERKTAGDEPKEIEWSEDRDKDSILQKELNETIVKSREEIEERLETEDRQQLGDISDEVYLQAVQNNRGDLRVALAESSKQIVPATGPRVVQHTTRSNKVTDTENKLQKSQIQADGRIVTETKRTVKHEEVNDDEVPDDGTRNFDDSEQEVRKEGSHRFLKQKDEELVDYVSGGERVAREMRYVSENTEGERTGDWPPVPTTMRTTRLHKHTGLSENLPTNRKDALTKKPLDLEEEDEARKVETSKWLESHFGSESRSSHGSLDSEDPPVQSGTNTSFINVTMKSLPMSPSKDRDNTWDRKHLHTSYSSHQQAPKRNDRRDSGASAGFYHGISEWSERYQNHNITEKLNSQPTNGPPIPYPEIRKNDGYQETGRNQVDWTYSNNYSSSRQQRQDTRSKIELQDTIDAPSPPLRRRAREQLLAKQEDKSHAIARVASPVNVVQRTWESRSRAIQKDKETVNHGDRLPKLKNSTRSRSTSPVAVSPTNQTKKSLALSANGRTPKATSQSKYKIGESFRKLVGKLRSASSERKNKRNNTASSVTQTDESSTYLQYNVIDKNIPLVTDGDLENKPPERPPRSPKLANKASWQQSIEAGPPVQRYYLGEDPFGGSIYGREKGYSGSKPASRHHQTGRPEVDSRVESNSIGRFSKSTSRLANEYDKNEQFRSTQTLPRKLHTQPRQIHVSSSTLSRTRPNQRQQKPHSPQSMTHSINNRQYGSMINISIKNTVTSSKLAANNAGPVPIKPERTYKSSLSRSKSFNVEANRDNGNLAIPYKSNLQLNRLDETPPLKSPGILASISRSNRDVFKAAKHEY
ncbi:uncharacterized protein LOC105688820 isoform X2 [Athalia rosae]|uniref:uncharacterized protein LOC105688820 isoform X2 n=1 Tax=Athalia rosae TaxID=37344 RepID=UPI0020343F5A|nr:uncharacterized protein LOC105688820 isoform X2 [Athalia rosae]